MKPSIIIYVAALSVSMSARAADTWRIEGIVVDNDGKQVTDFVAGTFWSANGKKWQKDGTFKPARTAKEIAVRWANEGIMLPHPSGIPRISKTVVSPWMSVMTCRLILFL